MLPDMPSFCNYAPGGVSSVSGVCGTHIENIGSRGGEHPRAYGHRVTHTLAVVEGNLGAGGIHITVSDRR